MNRSNVQVETSQGEKTFAAKEISAMVLVKMKETAEAFLGKKVTHAVVTVPAYFSSVQETPIFEVKNRPEGDGPLHQAVQEEEGQGPEEGREGCPEA